MILPQELEVYYVIPAIRKELSANLVKLGYSQKRIADLFGVSEACVSNYFNAKRAGKVEFTPDLKKIIKNYANKLSKSECCFISAVQAILKEFKESQALCDLHEELDDHVCGCKGCLI